MQFNSICKKLNDTGVPAHAAIDKERVIHRDEIDHCVNNFGDLDNHSFRMGWTTCSDFRSSKKPRQC